MTTTPKSAPVSTGPAAVFAALRGVLAKHAAELKVTRDDAQWYSVEAPRKPAPNGQPMMFGAVRVGKRFVSFYLMPAYTDPAVLDGMSPELAKWKQGKSCWNFTTADATLLGELAAITAAGLRAYREQGYV